MREEEMSVCDDDNVWRYCFELDRALRPDMIEWIESRRNTGAYLKALVDADMMRHGAVIRVNETFEKLSLLSVCVPVLLCRDDPDTEALFTGRGGKYRYAILENGVAAQFAADPADLEGAYRVIGRVAG